MPFSDVHELADVDDDLGDALIRDIPPHGRLSGLLLERIDVGVASLDGDLRIREVNTEFLRRFRRPFADVGDRAITRFVHPAAQTEVQQKLSGLVAGSATRTRARVRYQVPDGPGFAGELLALAVRGAVEDRIVVLICAEGRDGAGSGQSVQLSEVHSRILEGLAAGVPTVKLAQQLYLSRQGVEYHVRGMLREFRVSSRNALVARAYSLGVLEVGSWPPKVLAG